MPLSGLKILTIGLEEAEPDRLYQPLECLPSPFGEDCRGWVIFGSQIVVSRDMDILNRKGIYSRQNDR
jgi:hypothetical protein